MSLARRVWSARNKIIVFLAVVLVAVTISGTLMYHIEAIQAGDRQESIHVDPASDVLGDRDDDDGRLRRRRAADGGGESDLRDPDPAWATV